MKMVKKLMVGLTILLVLVTFVFAFVIQPIQVQGESMEPHFRSGQLYFVLKSGSLFNAGNHHYKKGEVVMVQVKSETMLRRVIGLPGDRIELSNGKIYLNGSLLDERAYLSKQMLQYLKQSTSTESLGPIELADDQYFVLPDNRENAVNLKEYAIVKDTSILGKVL